MTERERTMNRERISRRRAEWRKAGKCPECGGELDGRHRRCFSCRRKNAEYQARWQQKRRGGEVQ